MALIECPECSHQVSDSANICPNCGYNIANYVEVLNEEENYKRKLEEVKMPEYPKRSNSWIVAIILTLCFILFHYIMYASGIADIDNFDSTMGLGAILIICLIFGREIHFYDKLEKYRLALNNFEEYKKKMVSTQMSSTTKTVKCPNCKSSNTRKINTTDRIISTSLVGVASSKIGKQFECKDCGYKW